MSRAIGHPGALLMLAFDHRSSFAREVTGADEVEGSEAAVVEAAKRMVYDGLASAVERDSASDLGLLVDEQYGSAVVPLARRHGITVAVPVERSGRDVFEFEYGDNFMAHLRALDPDMAKVLVRLNPEGPSSDNELQLVRLRGLADELRPAGYGFLFELLVPPTERQLERCGGDRLRYEREVRPGLILRAVAMVQAAGIEPDVWKVEGVEDVEDARAIVELARDERRWEDVACTVLGAGAGDERVEHWLRVAAAAGFSGFAIGRSIWRDPVRRQLDGELDRGAAVELVRDRFLHFAEVFRSAAPR